LVSRDEQSLQFTWSSVTYANDYTVCAGPDPDTLTEYDTVRDTSLLIEGLEVGVPWYATVRASNSFGAGPVSLSVSAVPLPVCPENLKAAVHAVGSVILTWDAYEAADSFIVSWGITGSAETEITGITGSGIVISSVTPGSRYTFRMATVISEYTSQWSAPVSVTMYPTGSAAWLPRGTILLTPGTEENPGYRFDSFSGVSDVRYYRLSVTSGTEYHIAWTDLYDGKAAVEAAGHAEVCDVYISAGYAGSGSGLVSKADSGYASPSSFVAETDGWCLITVCPYTTQPSGWYGIACY
jgi:hypothetical protein